MLNPGTQDPRPTKDVFLSFRGVDTRAGFTTTLYNILVYNNVETFMDAENLPVGEEISDTLLDAIDKAKVAFIVFSENYASSSWCLDELAKIFECKDRRDRVGMKVIPVFYKVEPTIIRRQTGSYGIAMAVHKEKNDPERIKKWSSALISAANLSGLSTVDFKNEFQLMKRIVDVASEALVSWEEDFKMTQQARWLGNLVYDYFQNEPDVSESVESADAINWGDVAGAAAKVATGKKVKDERNEVAAAVASPKLGSGEAGHRSSHGKNVKDTENESLAAAVASPKLESGKAELKCSHGKNVKDTENESLAAAVASPKLESGKAGINCSHGKNVKDTENESLAAAVASPNLESGKAKDYDDLVFVSTDSSCYLRNSLKDILDSLGDESFGKVSIYSRDGEIGLAVRRLQGVKKMFKMNFKRKISAVAELQHENLVRLRAYYFRTDEILLFYDFMRTLRSLYEALHDHRNSGRRGMVWEIRLDIALGAARGIKSIHSQGVHMSHGNIKSSNILLGESNETRVADYCLADLVNPSSTLCATFDGYRAPEVTDPCKVSQEADVYSFG